MQWVKINNLPGPECHINRRGQVRQVVAIRGGRVCRNAMRTPSVSPSGFLYHTFRGDGRQASRMVHRMVATAYLPNPEGARYVAFKNGERADCRAANLRWSHRKPNAGTRAAKLSKRDVVEIRARAHQGHRGAHIARDFGVSRSHVSHILAGRRRS